jgi:3,4-dihydroxy-2-butanone 4-phosphate synthase
VFPLVARDGGVLERTGHTEAAVKPLTGDGRALIQREAERYCPQFSRTRASP